MYLASQSFVDQNISMNFFLLIYAYNIFGGPIKGVNRQKD